MQRIVAPLLNWYYFNKRILPWRIDNDPYHVWISEIMLQQTRIEAVIGYYDRFMLELPTIESLANCHIDRLLKLWEGLGYYNRARNLKKAAQIIMLEYQGFFPTTYEEILSLPGIGEYTASAIASICFSLKEAAVDGNVLRVYMRVNNCFDNIDILKTKRRVRNEIISIMPEDSGSFNESLMELGETICTPNGIPKCQECPIRSFCHSYAKKTTLQLPIRQDKKEKVLENYTVLLFFYQGKLAILKRNSVGLLHGMWQFPNLKGHLTTSDLECYLDNKNIFFTEIEKGISYVHVFTHKKWNMDSYFIYLSSEMGIEDVVWVTLNELEQIYALPTAFQPFKVFIEKEGILDDEA